MIFIKVKPEDIQSAKRNSFYHNPVSNAIMRSDPCVLLCRIDFSRIEIVYMNEERRVFKTPISMARSITLFNTTLDMKSRWFIIW